MLNLVFVQYQFLQCKGNPNNLGVLAHRPLGNSIPTCFTMPNLVVLSQCVPPKLGCTEAPLGGGMPDPYKHAPHHVNLIAVKSNITSVCMYRHMLENWAPCVPAFKVTQGHWN